MYDKDATFGNSNIQKIMLYELKLVDNIKEATKTYVVQKLNAYLITEH